MTFSLLKTTLLASVELSLNSIISLDHGYLKKAQALAGSIIEINCTSPKVNLYLTFHSSGIKLSSHFDGVVNTCINGSATALAGLLLTEHNKQSFYAKGLNVNGDIELLQNIQEITSKLNIDWEFHLSKLIGDIPTQSISSGINSVESFLNHSKDSLRLDIEEYVLQEKQLFPNQIAIEKFYSSIDNLKLRIDRSQARINKLSLPL